MSGNSGWRWKEQRKASLEILRQLGLGKVTMADRIQEEVTQFLKALHDTQGAPVDVAEMTHVSISNNICSILFGQRFEYGDPAFARYLNIVADNLKTAGGERTLGWWLVGWLVGWSLVNLDPQSVMIIIIMQICKAPTLRLKVLKLYFGWPAVLLVSSTGWIVRQLREMRLSGMLFFFFLFSL